MGARLGGYLLFRFIHLNLFYFGSHCLKPHTKWCILGLFNSFFRVSLNPKLQFIQILTIGKGIQDFHERRIPYFPGILSNFLFLTKLPIPLIYSLPFFFFCVIYITFYILQYKNNLILLANHILEVILKCQRRSFVGI